MLSRYGAHPRIEAVLTELVESWPRWTDSPEIQAVTTMRRWVNVVLYYILRELVQVFATVAKLTAFGQESIAKVTSALPTHSP